MSALLRISVAVEIKLGPFVDSTDGDTSETGLTIDDTEVRIAKNGGNWAAKSETTNPVHEENGFYRVLLGASDVDTAGILYICVKKTGALHVYDKYMVVDGDAYEALVQGSASLGVHVLTMEDNSITANVIADDAIDSGAITGGAASEIGAAVWADADGLGVISAVGEIDDLQNSIDDISGRIPDALGTDGRMKSISVHSITNGQADSGTTTTLVDTDLNQSGNYWEGNLVIFTNGTLNGQVRLIDSFDPGTDTITFTPATTTAVTNTHTYEIIAGPGRVKVADGGITVASFVTAVFTAIADILLRRSWGDAENSVVVGAGAVVYRSLLGAVAKLVNRVEVDASELRVYRDDDTTVLGTQTVVTTPGAEPITSLNTD